MTIPFDSCYEGGRNLRPPRVIYRFLVNRLLGGISFRYSIKGYPSLITIFAVTHLTTQSQTQEMGILRILARPARKRGHTSGAERPLD